MSHCDLFISLSGCLRLLVVNLPLFVVIWGLPAVALHPLVVI